MIGWFTHYDKLAREKAQIMPIKLRKRKQKISSADYSKNPAARLHLRCSEKIQVCSRLSVDDIRISISLLFRLKLCNIFLNGNSGRFISIVFVLLRCAKLRIYDFKSEMQSNTMEHIARESTCEKFA